VNDIYELPYHNRFYPGLVYVFLSLFGFIGFYAFVNPRFGWTASLIFGVLAILTIVLYFIKRIRIYIPTQDHGMISLFQKQPSGESVNSFLDHLKGKVSLVVKKAKKEPLEEFC
jgi:hypothetical protein